MSFPTKLRFENNWIDYVFPIKLRFEKNGIDFVLPNKAPL
jgi:hypothetical protein